MPLTKVNGQMLDGAITADSSGNVGIGTSSPSAPFQVSRSFADSAIEEIARFSRIGASPSSNNRAAALVFSDANNATLTAAVSGIRQNSNSDFNGALGFYTNNTGGSAATTVSQLTERMRIDSSGSLLIGTTSSPSSAMKIYTSDGTINSFYGYKAGGVEYIGTYSNHPLGFATNNTERMRIKAAGGVNINSTAADDVALQIGGFNTTLGTAQLVPNAAKGSSASHIHYGTNGDWYIRSANSSGNVIIQDSGGKVGIGTSSPGVLLDVTGWAYINQITGGRQNGAGNFHIDSNGGACYINYFSGANLYVGNGTSSGLGQVVASAFTVSDRNEKENIEYFNTGLAKVMQLKPAKFDMKNGQKGLKGFIAQDVQPIIPEAIGTMRRPDSDVDVLTLSNTALFPYLVAAIQELKAELDATKAEVAELKAKGQ